MRKSTARAPRYETLPSLSHSASSLSPLSSPNGCCRSGSADAAAAPEPPAQLQGYSSELHDGIASLIFPSSRHILPIFSLSLPTSIHLPHLLPASTSFHGCDHPSSHSSGRDVLHGQFEVLGAMVRCAFNYHLFPALSYLVTKDWGKVFYDCFGPEMLVAETLTIMIILWHHIFGPKKTDNMIYVIVHAFGLSLKFMSICMFAMFHSLSGGMKRAKKWYYIALAAFAWVTLLTFMWMQMGISIEKENYMRAFIGYMCAAALEVFQALWPAFIRLLKKNFVSDEKSIIWLKVSATILSIGVSSFELRQMVKEDFWSSHVERRYMVLGMISIIGGCLQLVVRYIGLEWFASPVEKCINRYHVWTEKLAQWMSFFGARNG